MKAQEIREMTDDAIVAAIADHEKQLMHLKMGNAIGTVESPIEIRQKRRTIARMKTILDQRQTQNS
ncbi:50S ribosomal protein L29 [Sulfidibacter corallicola]|uniref:Large ribosomal subunit protein uL29 n=1 Tax=Sulfidibacter corallicola TaxID=2818388 RepID=A0A8A4TE65_SULCO|nr:50S ribosomal protein L29 [Sulfidibacter corallicola]QTD47860.1 50S ribosomal protein L29 [Sulfidibacter corallicola]